LIRYGNSFYTAYCSVVVLHINKEVHLSSANSIRTSEMFITWLAVWHCNLIVQVGVVNMNIPVERS